MPPIHRAVMIAGSLAVALASESCAASEPEPDTTSPLGEAERALGGSAEGYLDAVNADGTIDGWALDPDTPSASIAVHLYVDGRFAGTIPTAVVRPDVNTARGVTGAHGFHAHLPASCWDGQVHQLELYAIDSYGAGPNPRLLLGNATVSRRVQLHNQAPEGYLDRVTVDGIVEGWARDPNSPNLGIDVHLYIDGAFVQVIHTAIYRPDVNASRGIAGNHGFRAAIPARYRDAGVHRLELYSIEPCGCGPNPAVLLGNAAVQKQFQLVPAVAPIWRYGGTESPLSSDWQGLSNARVPGFRSHFWGRPNPGVGCAVVANGATTTSARNPTLDTGVANDTSTRTWTPSCNGQSGDDYAVARPGAVGIFTKSGPTSVFFRGYSSAGDQSGVNAFINGNFLTFRLDAHAALTSKPRPWSGPQGTAVITSAQTVQSASAGNGVKLGQGHQAIGVTLLNHDSFTTGKKFAFQLVIFTAVIRSDGSYQTGPTLYADRAQRGLPIAYGEVGATTRYWTGLVPTLHAVGAGTFQVAITAAQLRALVRDFTTMALGHPATDVEAQTMWGPKAFDLEQWTMLQMSVSQEVYNAAQDDVGSNSSVYIGGNATSLELRAL